MKQFYQHLIFNLKEGFYYPGYVISTLVFPSLFFTVFAAPNVTDIESAKQFTLSFAAFGVLGVAFFQFAIAITNERNTNWDIVIRTLPSNGYARWAARLITVFLFSAMAALLAMLNSWLQTPFNMPIGQMFVVLLVLLVSALPFCAMAVTLSYLLSPQSALPVSNMIYLILSFTGGLWLPPEALPKFLEKISPWLPSRAMGEWVWAVANGTSVSDHYVFVLIGYTLVFLLTSVWLHSRFENENYS